MYKNFLELFNGRKLVVATMHGKEQVIAPILKQALGVDVIVPKNFNTDIYGTFSGEIERSLKPLEAAKIKCIDACKLTGCTLAVASEGSFGQHPAMFFMPADDEFMVLLDLENDIFIKTRLLSTETNFAGDTFNNWESIVEFATNAKFPSHGLIVRKAARENADLVKGITKWIDLEKHCKSFLATYGEVFLETDMRAMFNPSRMEVIEKLTYKLLKTIAKQCPSCNLPGYDVKKAIGGLKCSNCGLPTKSILAHQYECEKCEHKHLEYFPNGNEVEDPQFCDFCNP